MNRNVNGSAPSQVIDPEAMVCINCRHCFAQRLPPPNLGTVNVCKLLPPATVAVRDMRNQIVGFASAATIVTDTDFCAHFEKRELPGEKSQAANDEGKIVSGGTD